MPDKIGIKNLIPTLRDIGFLLLVIFVDMAVIMSTIYMEASGAKLALPNFKWPKELLALLTLLGISNYLTPSMVFGFGTTILMFTGTFLIVHYLVGAIGITQRFIINHNREELSQLLHPIIIAAVVGLLLYGGLFRLIMMPWAQLQLAKAFWPMDFQSVMQGDAIQAIQQAAPDMSLVLKKHEGESLKAVVANFPLGLLTMHLLGSLLTEIFFIHTMMNLGKIEDRIDEVVGRIRCRLSAAFQNVRRFRHRQPETTNADSPGQEGREDDHPTGAETNGLEIEPDSLSPADQPVRVIGGGEIVTPNTASQYPDLYVVEENADQTEAVNYKVYTRTFYEQLNGRK